MNRLRFLIVLTSCIALLAAPMRSARATPTPPPVDTLTLMDELSTYLGEAAFVPGTTRQGSVYLYDFNTKTEFTVNPEVRYSLTPAINVGLVFLFFKFLERQAFYRKQEIKITREQAVALAKAILCGDIAASNALLEVIGALVVDVRTPLAGIIQVSAPLDYNYGIQLVMPFNSTAPIITDGKVDPANADADPDRSGKTESIGAMLRDLILCAKEPIETRELTNATVEIVLPSPKNCRKIVNLMRANQINNLIEGGVPAGIPVAHKQGWSQDTHADIAYISTPGGDYLLVIHLHQRKFLLAEKSYPVIVEISRRVYNAYNPNAPLKEIRSQPIPKECKIPQSVIDDLMKEPAP